MFVLRWSYWSFLELSITPCLRVLILGLSVRLLPVLWAYKHTNVFAIVDSATLVDLQIKIEKACMASDPVTWWQWKS